MRTCYWCGGETPVIPGAPRGVITRSGAVVPRDDEACQDEAGALCLACLPEVVALLQALAWDDADEGEPPHA